MEARKKVNRKSKLHNFTLKPLAAERLRELSEKSGMNMSAIVSTLLIQARLRHLSRFLLNTAE